jgi:hypothetical protein
METLLKLIVLAGALIGLWFAVSFIFFYERFKVFNDLLNNDFMVGKDKYGEGRGFLLDTWVFGWHTVIGIMVLLISGWLFYVFYRYARY